MNARVVVDPITRIEGHLRIEAQMDGNKIGQAYSSGTMVRGIEIILQGRDPRDAWAFAQRICGVCTLVHGVASIRSVENAIGAKVPPNAELIRNLMIGAQYIHDHVMHFYHLHALDWVDVVSALSADPKATAALWDKLMRDVLGYDTYIAQGGDWGSVVSGWLAYNHSTAKGGGCKAVHLNMWGVRPSVLPETEEEQKWAAGAAMTFELESAYLRLQMTKPQTLSYAMMDSPVGAAAWITEKFHGWSDRRGKDGKEHVENAFTRDQLLTNIMIYLVTDTFGTATWFYRGMFEEGGTNMAPGTKVEIPTAIANFPKEFLVFPPRSMVEKGYNIVRWTDFEHGGHFAALETGEVFANDVLAFVNQIRG